MRIFQTQKLTWGIVGLVVVGIIIQLILWVSSLTGLPTLFDAVEALGWSMIVPLVFSIFWGIGLLALVGGSVVSLFVRFRKAKRIERQQIKWLLYAGVLFASYYGLTFS